MERGRIEALRGWIRRGLRAPHESVRLGLLLALVGGFLDAYTFLDRGGVFANAQTGNLVLIGIAASRGDLRQMGICLPPILAFMAGVFAVEAAKSSALSPRLDWGRFALVLEILVLCAVGFVPESAPDLFVNAAVSFAASVQVCAFRRLVDVPYSTTMMTGNLRSATQSLWAALATRDPGEMERVRRFLAVLGSFTLGALMGGILTSLGGGRAVWLAAGLLAAALSLYVREETPG